MSVLDPCSRCRAFGLAGFMFRKRWRALLVATGMTVAFYVSALGEARGQGIDTYIWQGTQATNRDGDFGVGTNWNIDVPAADQIAQFSESGDSEYAVSFSGDQSTYGLRFAHGSSTTIDFLSTGGSINYGVKFAEIDANTGLYLNDGIRLSVNSTDLETTVADPGLTLNGTLLVDVGATVLNSQFDSRIAGSLQNFGTVNLGTEGFVKVNVSGSIQSWATTSTGSMTLSGSVAVYDGSLTSSNIQFDGTSGSLSVTGGQANVDYLGITSSSKGQVTLSGGDLYVGGIVNVGAGGSITVSHPNSTLSVGGDLSYTGELNVTDGNVYVYGQGSMGSGTLNQSGGMVTFYNDLTVGTTQLSNGYLYAPTMSSTVEITGGGLYITGGNLTGDVTISDGGALNAYANDSGVVGNVTLLTEGYAKIGVLDGNASVASSARLEANEITGTLSLGTGQYTQATVGRVGGDVTMTGGTLSAREVAGSISQSGGQLAPGNSPGAMSIVGDLELSGGSFQLDVEALSGTPGEQWDSIDVGGSLVGLGSGSYTIFVTSNGSIAGWDASKNYEWEFLTAGDIVGFSPDTGLGYSLLGDLKLYINVDHFHDGNTLDELWYVREGNSNNLVLGYNAAAAVPEPSSFAVLGMLGAAGLGVRRWRRRKSLPTGSANTTEVAQVV